MSDNAYFENLIANAKDGETVVVEPKTNGDPYLITDVIAVWRPITIDFNGQTMIFEYVTGEKTEIPGKPDQPGKRKGFYVQKGGPNFPPTPHTDEFSRVVFKNGIFLGVDAETDQEEPDYWKSHFGPVLSAWAQDLTIDLFQIDSCVFRNLAFGCNFNCSLPGGGTIRHAVLSNCLFDNIVQDPNADPPNDQHRGKGAAFAFRPQEKMLLDAEDIEYICGISYGNVFKDCVRHCLYVSHGGPFISVGDTFLNHSKDVVPQFRVGALQLSRGGRMKVVGAYFQDGVTVHGRRAHDDAIRRVG